MPIKRKSGSTKVAATKSKTTKLSSVIAKPKEKPKLKPEPLDFQGLAQEFLDKVGISASVTFIQEPEILKFQIETSDQGIVIGYHGETLAAIQLLLSLMIENQTGVWQQVSVNVGDYRQRREETLRSLALTTAQRVKFSGQPWPLPPLSASERRIVHLALADDPDVVTESEGDGPSRRVVVKPRPE